MAGLVAGTGTAPEVWVALGPARVYAAGVYLPDRRQLALVALRAHGGLTAVPVFLDIPTLLRWRPDARPLARTGRELAGIAVAEGYAAMVLDPGGPGEVAVPADVLADLALGFQPDGARPGLSTRRTAGAPRLSVAALPPGPRLRAALALALETPLVAGRVDAVYALDVAESGGDALPALGVASAPGEPLDDICLELAGRLADLLRSDPARPVDPERPASAPTAPEPSYAVLALTADLSAALPAGAFRSWPPGPEETW